MKVVLINTVSKELIKLENVEFLQTDSNGSYFLTTINFKNDDRNHDYENCYVFGIVNK